MELHNKTLIQEIESWKSEFPYLNSFFELSIIKGFIAIADIIPNKDKYQKLIVNYVSGLIDLFIYFQTKNEDYLEEFDLKTKDYFKIVLKIVNSKNYQNYLIDKSIPVSRTLLIDGINLVIKDEIKIHIQRNNVMPLTSNDLDSLETDLINFSRKKYQKYAPKQKEAIVTTIDSEKWDIKEIYNRFNNHIFRCDKDVFKDWLVTGVGHDDTIVMKTSFRQCVFFLHQVLKEPNQAKTKYFKWVFGEKYQSDNIKSKDYVNDFDELFARKLILCKKIIPK